MAPIDTLLKHNSQRFNAYTKKEVPVLLPIEFQMMEEMGVDRSELPNIASRMYGTEVSKNLFVRWQTPRLGEEVDNALNEFKRKWGIKPVDFLIMTVMEKHMQASKNNWRRSNERHLQTVY